MDTKKTWLSIIIPIFNGEKYLRKCLNSIAKQSFENYEVILVDDGSTDSSAQICHEFCVCDQRFRYYRVDNGGPLRARVFGAKHVNGEYFAFCDSDDYYHHNNVFKLLFNKVSNLSKIIRKSGV